MALRAPTPSLNTIEQHTMSLSNCQNFDKFTFECYIVNELNITVSFQQIYNKFTLSDNIDNFFTQTYYL